MHQGFGDGRILAFRARNISEFQYPSRRTAKAILAGCRFDSRLGFLLCADTKPIVKPGKQ